MDMLSCPKCGGSFYVPTTYDPSEVGKEHRSCCCDFFSDSLSGNLSNMDQITSTLNEHSRLLQILMRCFQRNSPSTYAAAPPWPDLNIDISRIPEAMKQRAIKRFEANNANVDANITLCKYCGTSYNNGTANVGDGIAITALFVCYECGEVRKHVPYAFDLITRMFQWVYGEPEPSPPAALPIPTPEPAPIPENPRNILI